MEERHQEQLQVCAELEKRIEQEQQGRRNLEAVIIKDRKEAEQHVHEVEAQMETINMNFQMAVAGTTHARIVLLSIPHCCDEFLWVCLYVLGR